MNKKYAFITLLVFVIEVTIALFFKDSFVRPLLGDVLVVILIFSFVRIFYSGNTLRLAIGILLFSFLIEFSQYFKLIERIGLQEVKLAQVVLGSSFDILDLVAYSVGVVIAFFMDQKLSEAR